MRLKLAGIYPYLLSNPPIECHVDPRRLGKACFTFPKYVYKEFVTLFMDRLVDDYL